MRYEGMGQVVPLAGVATEVPLAELYERTSVAERA